MVLGTSQGTSEYQYSLKVEIWQPDKEGVTQCHKPPLRELWSSETNTNHTGLVLVRLEPCMAKFSGVQSANNSADLQNAKFLISDTVWAVKSPQQSNRTTGGQYHTKNREFKRGINP